MNNHVKLINRTIIAGEILEFSCEKPEGYEFVAGQFCFLNVPDIGFHDERGLRRHLSFASSPLEENLLFATKISDSAFKKTLKVMPIGGAIGLEKPLGSLRLPEDASIPVVFLAGGIGIVPFRSMIKYAADGSTGHVITLFYSNRVPEEAVFLKELQGIAEKHGNISVLATMTRTEQSSEKWEGLRGRISSSMIKENYGEWRESKYYIAGPPNMVDVMKETLIEMNIPAGQIHTEKFTGYQ